MSKAIALTRSYATDGAEAIRFAIVAACGCALVAAGQAFPIIF